MGEHALGYSTHSHYLIEPKWLEQTFVITNRSDTPEQSILDEVSLDDESLDIQAHLYRKFVSANPSKTSYFQPILDRLQVVPSKFDLQNKSIVVEGKSDYYFLRYCIELNKSEDLSILPALGAGTFDALMSLHVGWNLSCLFLLDGDRAGEKEKGRYVRDYCLDPSSILTLKDINKDFKGVESLIDDSALEIIASSIGVKGKPSKKEISTFFQERIAGNAVIDLGERFLETAKSVLENLVKRIG